MVDVMTDIFTAVGQDPKPGDELDMSKNTPKQDTVGDRTPGKPIENDASEIQLETSEAAEVLASEPSSEQKLKEELDQTKDRFLRLAADFENYKRIAQREQQNGVKFANEALLLNLLPVIDSLEEAIKASKKSGEPNNDVLVGLDMVLKQFRETLNKYGVEALNSHGTLFDPARHEALTEQVDDSVPAGTVVVEYQKGYLLHGRLLRPARVAVAKNSEKGSCDL